MIKVSKKFIQILNMTCKLRLKEIELDNMVTKTSLKTYQDITNELITLINERNEYRYDLSQEYKVYQFQEMIKKNYFKNNKYMQKFIKNTVIDV